MAIFFINWNIYGLIPFNASRSNSIIVINYAYKQGAAGYDLNEIKSHVAEEYFEKYKAVELRLEEQIGAGNIELIDNKFYITRKGKIIAKIFFCVSSLYSIENNFLRDVRCEI